MKIAFLINQQTNEVLKVAEMLKAQGYSVLKTSVEDEVAQAGQQANKVVLVFDEPKFAYKFCGMHSWSGFEILKILFLGKKLIMSPDIAQKLSSVGLKVFSVGEEEALKDRIQQFENKSEAIIDLEFSIVSELQNESAAKKK
jgi:hypothetical protein